MASRGRGGSTMTSDWDPMRSEYETSVYETNDEGSVYGQLDHSRLYVTNIPKALNEDGLRAAFAKYGTLVESHLSADPNKRYALIKFETQGEAKIAMMKLNNTEPLKLVISIAYKQKLPQQQAKRRQTTPKRGNNNNKKHSNRQPSMDTTPAVRDVDNDNVSVASSRRFDRLDTTNGDEDYLEELEDMEDLDPDLDLELEKLRLRATQLLYKQKLRDVKLAERRTVSSGVGSRCMMADGKIVVRTTAPNDDRDRDCETSGAGDSSSPSRACVRCGARAEAFCARCGVTPYCGAACQQRDWTRRHSAVCHNLARSPNANSASVEDAVEVVSPPAAPPLRRPRSPIDDARRNQTANNRQDKKPYQNEQQPPNANANANVNARANNSNTSNNHSNNNARPNNQYANSNGRPNNNNARSNANGKSNAAATYGNRNMPGRRPPLKHETRAEDEAPKAKSPPQSVTSPRQPTNACPKPNAQANVAAAEPTRAAPKSNVEQPVEAPVRPVETPVGFKKAGAVPEKRVEEKPLVPAKCVADLVPVGQTLLLSIDAHASECADDVTGFVCLSMHPDYQDSYMLLCEEFLAACEEDAEEFKPAPGDAISILDAADSSWYRGRQLTPSTAALLDAARLMDTKGARCRKLREKYAALPEYCCVLVAQGVKIGDSLTCTVKSRSTDGQLTADIADANSGEARGQAVIRRWKPRVEMPKEPVAVSPKAPVTMSPKAPVTMSPKPPVQEAVAPAPAVAPTEQKPVPEVPRPPLYNDTQVLIVDVDAKRVIVRAADSTAARLAGLLEQDVAAYGLTAKPLSESPEPGQTVVALFTDGIHYRALVRRTKPAENKYLVEYIEYGNSEVMTLERLFPCPETLGLKARPPLTSAAKIQGLPTAMTPNAVAYLDSIKEQTATLTIPGGAATAPSGSEVLLTLDKNKENVSRKLQELCTPDWKKVQDAGADVLSTQILHMSDVEYVPLPPAGCRLRLLDVATLAFGSVAGYPVERTAALTDIDALATRMAEYCESELGRDPYLPRIEELCISKFPDDGQWYRAVLCDFPQGPGGATAEVSYLDYGNLCTVPTNSLRKLQPEFLRGIPALATTLEIRGFPEKLSPAALKAASEFLKIDTDGTGGELTVTKCEMSSPGFYIVDAPDLLAAIAGL